MKINYLFRQTLLLLALFALCGGAFAQTTQEYGSERNKFWIDLNAGIGGTCSYDESTVPFAYGGFHNMEQIGFTDEWKRCHIQLLGSRIKTNYFDVEGSCGSYSANLEFLYSCLNPTVKRWHIWAGASTSNLIDLKELEDLQNASLTLSFFHEISAEGKVECDFAYDKADASHPWMSAFFSFSVPLYTIASRPDFAYVVDPMNNVFDALFGANTVVFKFFPGCTTDLGFNLNLRNGNRIGLSYTWDYLTTGNKGFYRYDNAFHTVKLSFMFKIH